MPQVGERSKRKSGAEAIWALCLDCGIGRWNSLKRGKPISQRCRSCSAKRTVAAKGHPPWKGAGNPNFGKGYGFKKGQKQNNRDRALWVYQRGYKLIRLLPGDFFYPMVNSQGFVREHRLVVASVMSRCLHQWEVVHHKNRIKDDNRYENLEVNTIDEHNTITGMQNRVDALVKENEQLKRELANLKK